MEIVTARSIYSFIRAGFLTFIIAVITGCSSLTLISDYDAETDKQLTALQQFTDAFVSKMLAEIPKWDKGKKSAKNAYDSQKTFYREFDNKLRLLEFRVQSIRKNSKTQKLVSYIRDAVLLRDEHEKQCEEEGLVIKDGEETKYTSLQSLHCLKDNKAQGPSRLSLEINQRNINQVIGAALALEVAKKQGVESNK